jgi:aryl-alcohol dehydrogenase-like predicted oxidoreductase
MGNGQPGLTGTKLSELGQGCMGMYGLTDPAESIATICAALEHGIALLAAGDFHAMGRNEMFIAKAQTASGAARQ